MKLSRKWLAVAFVVGLAPQPLMYWLLPPDGALEILVRIAGFCGWGWLVGTWAGKQAGREERKKPRI